MFRTRALSPLELVSALLERIEHLDGSVNAFLFVDRDGALERARLAEREMGAGQWRGPMHGIPVAVKDMIDVGGLPTTCHSAILSANIASKDADVIARLRQAGAIILGKTALHEFATGGPTNDLPWPPARNPWNYSLHPGGSSSGSAAAVIAGFVPAALGTDTGGSIRNPATCCGLVGLKPTYDLVSRNGVFPLAFSLDHVGPITRSAADAAIVLGSIGGGRDGTLSGSSATKPASPVREPQAGIEGVRIGVVEHFYMEDSSADPQMIGGLDAAVDVLRGLGATVEAVRLSPLSVWAGCGRVIQQAEQYVVHEQWLRTRPQDYCHASRMKLVAGAFLSAHEYIQALQLRRMLCDEFSRLMSRLDVIVTLSSFDFPCPLDDKAAISSTYGRHARMPFNVTGTPAMAIPVGFSDVGLPLGIQIAGKAYDEGMLIRIAKAYEQATRWAARRPGPLDRSHGREGGPILFRGSGAATASDASRVQ